MNIGIDIDDTITDTFNTQFNLAQKFTIETLNKTARINKPENFKYQYYCREFHNWTEEENLKFWKENYESILKNSKPKPYVKEILDRLKSDGHKIIIITARFSLDNINPEDITRKWLEDNEIRYDKLIVNAKNKKKVANENNIDIFIDDDIENCQEVAELNIPTLLMDSYHNSNLDGKDAIRVYSWLHVYQEIKML